MRGFIKYAGAIAGLSIASACTGNSAVAPQTVGFDRAYIGASAIPLGAQRTGGSIRYDAVLPHHRSSSKAFEYVSGLYDNGIAIFDYPTSDQQIGSIANAGGGAGCANALYGYGKKFFWVVGNAEVTEYRVEQKPVRTISVPGYNLSGCAMDAKGDLAVGVLFGTGGGAVIIFKHARGKGIQYPSGLSRAYALGYDGDGNLFADGMSSNYTFAFAELPKGQKQFHIITTSNTVGFPGSVQWDGKYLDVTDQDNNALYQYSVRGTVATLKGTVSLSGASDCAQTWIATGVVFCADAGNNAAYVYPYPAGGPASAVLTGYFDLPLGIVAAEK